MPGAKIHSSTFASWRARAVKDFEDIFPRPEKHPSLCKEVEEPSGAPVCPHRKG